jgi:hypothetical protein
LSLGPEAWVTKLQAGSLFTEPRADKDSAAVSTKEMEAGASAPAAIIVATAVGGALLLASKACEQVKRLRDIVNALAAYISPASTPVALGVPYDSLKKALVRWEGFFLRQIAFDVDSVTCRVHDCVASAASDQHAGGGRAAPITSTAFAVASDIGLMLRVWPSGTAAPTQSDTSSFAQACVDAASEISSLRESAVEAELKTSGVARQLVDLCQQGVSWPSGR